MQLATHGTLASSLACAGSVVSVLRRWKSTHAYVPKRASFPGQVVESMKLQDGKGIYASVTATLQPPGRLGMQQGISAVVTATWELVRRYFKGQRPDVLLMYTSLGKPLARAAAKQLSRVANHGYDTPVVVAGCSASRWRPEGEASRVDKEHDAYRAHHFSLTAMQLQDITPYAFTAYTDSLPSLPLLEEALGARPPQFMLFTHPTNQYGSHQSNLLMRRFENIFPQSSIVAVVADYIDAKERPMFVQNGIAMTECPAQSTGQVQQGPLGRKRKSPSRQGSTDECPASTSSNSTSSSSSTPPYPADGTLAARADPLFQEVEDSHGSLLFVSDDTGAVQVLERGSVGIALYPRTAKHRMPPKSVLNLVRVMAGGFRFEASNRMLLADPVHQLLSPLHIPVAAPSLLTPSTPTSVTLPSLPSSLGSSSSAGPHKSVGATFDESEGVGGATRSEGSKKGQGSGSEGSNRGQGVGRLAACVSPKGIQGQAGKNLKPPLQQALEVPMFVLADVSLFPDQAMDLKVFEPRYQLLVRQCIEDGARLGISQAGVGTLAQVTACRASDSGHCIVEVLGGARFRYVPHSARVLPACFGLTAALVEGLQDDMPGAEYKGPTCDLAVQALQLLLQEWVSQVRKRSLVESTAAALASSEDLTRAKQMHATLSAGYQRTSIVMTDEAVEMKKKVVEEMDVLQAQAVSLWLGGLLSNSIVPQYMKREWLSSQNTYVRLGQQVQLLNQHYQLRREAVLALMRQTSHPLRKMLAIF